MAQARLFDVGHSHGTFLTDEFGFALARRNALALRVAALCAGLRSCLRSGSRRAASGSAIALLAAVVCLSGLLAERWLFFAEARHTVRLYHGDART